MVDNHSPVVLVHGAWFGSWCWDDVARDLADRGVITTAVDLPGRPGNPLPLDDVNLSVVVEHIEHVVEGATEPCVVVGHSLAGVALNELGERRPELIRRIVYVAAFLLRSGQSATDIIRSDKRTRVHEARRIAEDLRSSTIDPASIGTVLCNDCTESALRAVQKRLVAESTTIARTRVDWTEKRFGAIQRTYVVCERDRIIDPSVQRLMASNVGCEKVHSLNAGHAPFLSRPKSLSSLIAAAATAPSGAAG
jgi:pimeloyl-ACP methyl ester carboxylesterase